MDGGTMIGAWRIVEMELWDRDAIELPDRSLKGRIFFHMGDDSEFRANPVERV